MFRLVKFFSITSATVIVVVIALLMVFFKHISEEDLIRFGQRQNEILALSICNDLQNRYGHRSETNDMSNLMVSLAKVSAAEVEEMLLPQLKRLSVLDVEVLDLNELVVLATTRDKNFRNDSNHKDFITARNGSSTSRIVPVVEGSSLHPTLGSIQMLTSFLPMKTEAGKVVGIIKIDTDITKLLKEIDEHVLHVFIALLAGLTVLYLVLLQVVRRADKIIKKQHVDLQTNEEKLRHAVEVAEKSDRAKSQFLSSMSHELRTPLNSIMGFAQLLQLKSADFQGSSKFTNYAKQIINGGEYLLELINQVLDLSKIEAGKFTLSIESVEPASVIEDCIDMFKERALESDVGLINETLDVNLPILRTDKSRFRQILLNLFSNAVKYNSPGGTVTITSEAGENGFQRFSVKDTGRGIRASMQSGLFEPFERLGLEAGEIEGTGIGLTITHQLTELLEGHIGFESEEGVGSTFWVELPISEDQSTCKRDEADSISPAETLEVAKGQNKTLLYIEDNPPNLKLVEALIEEIGNLIMLSAPDAESGLDVAKSKQPDLILMDINLPGMNGFEALEVLKSDERTKNIPVIALSAAAMPNEIQKGQQAGFADYLIKPIDVLKVIKTFDMYLK